jgi:hypothetical protein
MDSDALEVVSNSPQLNIAVEAEVLCFDVKEMQTGKLKRSPWIAVWTPIHFEIFEVGDDELFPWSGLLRRGCILRELPPFVLGANQT